MNEVVIDVIQNNSFRQFKRYIPRNWSELDKSKTVETLRTLAVQEPKIAKLSVLKSFMNLPGDLFFKLDPEVVLQLQELISFIDLEDIHPKALISSFNFRGIEYALPKEKFSNGTCKEYAMASDAYDELVSGNNTKSIYRLMAVLCRPVTKPDDASDVRDKLTSMGEVQKRAELFEKVPNQYVMNALVYFHGVRKYVHFAYQQWLFPKPETDEDGNEVESTGEGPLFGWWSTFFSIAEGGVFGDLNQVHNYNFHTICMYLIDKIKQRKDQERADELKRASNQS